MAPALNLGFPCVLGAIVLCGAAHAYSIGLHTSAILWLVIGTVFVLALAWPSSDEDELAVPVPANGTCNVNGFNVNNVLDSANLEPCMPVSKPGSASSQEGLTGWTACCSSRNNGKGTADTGPPLPAKLSVANRPTNHCSIATKKGASDLRGRLDDLLGPRSWVFDFESATTGPMDEVAVTAFERYGGGWNCLVRFLRARKFNVDAAETMLRNTIDFRRRLNVNHINSEVCNREVWNRIRPHFTAMPVSFTAGGNVVIYFKMANFLRLWKLGFSEEHLRIFYLSWMERMLALQIRGREMLGGGSESELPTCIEVYDLKGIGIMHIKCITGLRLMSRILRIGQDHYPENLHTAVILNVPAIAHKLMWMVQHTLDAGTLAKLRFAKDHGHDLLADVLQSDPEEAWRLFQQAEDSDYTRGLSF